MFFSCPVSEVVKKTLYLFEDAAMDLGAVLQAFTFFFFFPNISLSICFNYFFFPPPGCCAWMLLFAYIMFVPATVTTLKVVMVTDFAVVPFRKQGKSAGLAAGPGARRTDFRSCFGCRCLPELPLPGMSKAFQCLGFLFIWGGGVGVLDVGQQPLASKIFA